jgi:hypothetical protein
MKFREYLIGGLFSSSIVVMLFAILYQPPPPVLLIYTPGDVITPSPPPFPLAILGYLAAFFFPGAIFAFARRDFGKSIYLKAGILLMLLGHGILFYKGGYGPTIDILNIIISSILVLIVTFIHMAITALIGGLGCAAGDAVRKVLSK